MLEGNFCYWTLNIILNQGHNYLLSKIMYLAYILEQTWIKSRNVHISLFAGKILNIKLRKDIFRNGNQYVGIWDQRCDIGKSKYMNTRFRIRECGINFLTNLYRNSNLFWASHWEYPDQWCRPAFTGVLESWILRIWLSHQVKEI